MKKTWKQVAIGVVSSLIASVIWNQILSPTPLKIADMTIGTILHFMLVNFIPMIFMTISIIALIRANYLKSIMLPNIKLIEAKYGIPNTTSVTDVTQLIQDEISAGHYTLSAANYILCGKQDPAPGVRDKVLIIKYKLGGREKTVIKKEEESISLY